jgi:hypothetical protein
VFLRDFKKRVTIEHHVYKKILSKNEIFENGQEFWENGQKGFEILFFFVFLFFSFLFCAIFNKKYPYHKYF